MTPSPSPSRSRSHLPALLRIPVISFKTGLVDAVQRRLLATESPASERLRAGTLELIEIPLPKFPTATNDPTSNQNEELDEPAETQWELTPEHERVLTDATIVLADAHHAAPLLLNGAKKLPHDKQHVLKNVQWVQATYAGVDAFLKLLLVPRADSHGSTAGGANGATNAAVASALPPFTLTRAGAIKGMAQYVFGWIIMLERKFLEAKAFQAQRQYAKAELSYRPHKSLTVGVLGFGAIGQAIGQLLKAAGFRVTGFRRRAPDANDTDAAVLAQCAHRVSTDLTDVLATSDYIVSILPSTPATKYLLTLDVLAACAAKQPVLLSVGRGDVVSEATLLDALERQYLSRVVLDVFEREPLRPESALWRHPRVLLTPHVSAKCFADDVADVFADNLVRYLTHQPMLYTVDWASGY